MSSVEKFAELFRGRLDAYGTEEGGCDRQEGSLATHDLWGLYLDRVQAHLFGSVPMGTYPVVDNKVMWGCVDFDEGEEESWAHAVNVASVLISFGIQGWVERSRSKGYHVWVFCEHWMPAQLMRRALLAACQIVDAPTREINPKAEELRSDQLGNYVRLPYPYHAANTTRRQMIDGMDAVIPLEVFLAGVRQCSAPQLEELAALWQPPPKPKPPIILDDSRAAIPVWDRLDGLSYTIAKNGPKEGGDRSSTLWALACALKRGGAVKYHEALQVLYEADAAWGKYTERGDVEELNRMLDKAWSTT